MPPPPSPSPPSWLTPTPTYLTTAHAHQTSLETSRRLTPPGAFVNTPLAHAKNRHVTAQPYASNRIHLQSSPSGDYINASPIALTPTGPRYIATQNPTSIPDFWLMVLQENVPAIVMLMPASGSGAAGRGRDRCARYYPREVGEVVVAGDIEVELVKLEEAESQPPVWACTEVRELRVRRGGKEREVSHFAFAAWPDHGVPEGPDRLALLPLVKLSRGAAGADGGPRLVHCSAGCGRTGTFIALDFLLEEMERGGFEGEVEGDPVVEVVGCLREQRIWMVETVGQLGLLYNVLRWRWEDMNGVGEGGSEGTNLDWTFVKGGVKKSQKKEKWAGLRKVGEGGGEEEAGKRIEGMNGSKVFVDLEEEVLRDGVKHRTNIDGKLGGGVSGVEVSEILQVF